MSYTYRRISLAEAMAELHEDGLFGPSYDARQTQLAGARKARSATMRGAAQMNMIEALEVTRGTRMIARPEASTNTDVGYFIASDNRIWRYDRLNIGADFRPRPTPDGIRHAEWLSKPWIVVERPR